MTIRQYLVRRNDRYAMLAVAFLLAMGIAAGYAPRILAIRIVFAILIGVVLAAAFWSLFEIPCPNCGKANGAHRVLGECGAGGQNAGTLSTLRYRS